MKKIRSYLENIEVVVEDIVIIILSIVAILVVVSIAIAFTTYPELQALPTFQKVSQLGFALYPWFVMLGMMLIARDLWLIRKKLEKDKKEKE